MAAHPKAPIPFGTASDSGRYIDGCRELLICPKEMSFRIIAVKEPKEAQIRRVRWRIPPHVLASNLPFNLTGRTDKEVKLVREPIDNGAVEISKQRMESAQTPWFFVTQLRILCAPMKKYKVIVQARSYSLNNNQTTGWFADLDCQQNTPVLYDLGFLMVFATMEGNTFLRSSSISFFRKKPSACKTFTRTIDDHHEQTIRLACVLSPTLFMPTAGITATK